MRVIVRGSEWNITMGSSAADTVAEADVGRAILQGAFGRLEILDPEDGRLLVFATKEIKQLLVTTPRTDKVLVVKRESE